MSTTITFVPTAEYQALRELSCINAESNDDEIQSVTLVLTFFLNTCYNADVTWLEMSALIKNSCTRCRRSHILKTEGEL